MAESKPVRKSPAQKSELVINFIPEYGHYRVVATHGATVPAELDGMYTNKKLAEEATTLYYNKKK